MKDFVQPRDGHGAYCVLFNHHLSRKQPVCCLGKALAMISYNGEGCHQNFEKYVTAEKKHHQILEGLVCYGYLGSDLTMTV
jgi:hypothetical protein